jgi:hypothetical protein
MCGSIRVRREVRIAEPRVVYCEGCEILREVKTWIAFPDGAVYL